MSMPAQASASPAPADQYSSLPPATDSALDPQYQVPQGYRRPYGQVYTDRRGRGFYMAALSLGVAVTSYLLVFLGGSLAATALIPAVGALVLGIRALMLRARSPKTAQDAQTLWYSVGGIALGALAIPLAIGMLLLESWFLQVANEAACEAQHRGDDAAIAACMGQE